VDRFIIWQGQATRFVFNVLTADIARVPVINYLLISDRSVNIKVYTLIISTYSILVTRQKDFEQRTMRFFYCDISTG
jgi:hypothetical protein